jgi:hypothetical protein
MCNGGSTAGAGKEFARSTRLMRAKEPTEEEE